MQSVTVYTNINLLNMTNTHIRFQNNDSDGSLSDSEDDYTENEKNLLRKVRNRNTNESESENEVYGLGSQEESDNDSNIALSDVEGQEDNDDLPDIRAWGKDKRKFYSTDYVDPDYGGFQGKDGTLAELEEEEAKNLQKQLAQQLDDADFSLEMFINKKEEENKDNLQEIIKTDVSKLSKHQKLQLLKNESPEFFELIEDFKEKMILAKEALKPALTLSKSDKIKTCDALDFVKLHYEIILNYCVNISMYLFLKASKVNITNHPIIKRLLQYRQQLTHMQNVLEEIIKPQLDILMNLEENELDTTTKKKTLKLLTKFTSKKRKEDANVIEDQPSKKKTKQEISEIGDDIEEYSKHVEFATDNGLVEIENDEEKNKSDDNGGNAMIGERRAVTYQMIKNKGLTPHRKKEQRNPRVKHRNKFKKAKARRRGAIREVRKELSRYGGEVSGIKASVTKSIKIKG